MDALDALSETEKNELKVKLTKHLSSNFPNAGNVDSVARAGSGANILGHIKVSTTTKKFFGFKTWHTGPQNGHPHELCAERELLMHQIAKLVGVPHLCEVKHIDDFDFDVFTGHPVSISEWMPDSVSIQKMDSDMCKVIKNENDSFFNQFGQWLAFGAAVGYQDWTPNNFIWAHRSHTLAMIDMDWCFESHNSFQRDPVMCIAPFGGMVSSRVQTCANEIRQGIESMNRILETRISEMNTLIRTAKHGQTSSFVAEVKHQQLTTILTKIESSLGN
jgi:hypothetical protein